MVDCSPFSIPPKKICSPKRADFRADDAAIFDPSPRMRPGHLGACQANQSESGQEVRGERAAIVSPFVFSKSNREKVRELWESSRSR